MKRILTAVALTATCAIAFAQPKLTKDNIDEVLKAMTLEEKADLCVGSGWGSMGIGSMTAADEVLVPGAAGTTKAIPRLGIPQTVVSDGPAGLRINPTRPGTSDTFYCTGFPVGTVLACTWNTEMVEYLLQAMGNEVREYGADVLLAPGANIHRNPLCGRNFEYFSEDPLLAGKISAAYIRGIQSQGVGVSLKHFAGNNQEINRMNNDTRVNPRALREIYLKHFEIAVKDADPWTIMSSYNKINGYFTQQNPELLQTILRDEWGFKGIVMTDWGSKEGTVDAVRAGNDLMEPGMPQEAQRIVAAVKDGSLSEKDLDRNVRRMLEYIVRTPRFSGYKYSNKPDLTAHAELVRKAAAEGMVLLKNDCSTLPVSGGKVALFGLNAYKTIAGGTGSGNVNKPYIRNIDEGLKNAGYSIDAKIADFYAKYRAFNDSQNALSASERGGMFGGGVLLGEAVLPEVALTKTAVANSVNRNDVAVVVIGRNAGEGDDRRVADDFYLTSIERDLLTNVCDEYHKAGKKVIVVLNIGGVIETASWKSLPDAILLAWTPGQEAGNTVADILSGKSNPSGKLSMTFPLNYFDIPSSVNFPFEGNRNSGNGMMAMLAGMGIPGAGRGRQPQLTKNIDYTDYAEGIWVGYRYFDTADKEVSYPFGFGLSYTDFAYSAPVVKVGKDGGIVASITVKNTGSVAGKEAVQIYVSAPDGGLVKPEKELKGFAKTRELQPGESQTLTVNIDPYTLASFNEDASEWQTAAGKYIVNFASNVQDVRASGTVSLKAKSWKANRVLLPKEPVAEISVR